MLGGRVDGKAGRAGHARHGGDIDHRGAAPAGAELPLHGRELVLHRIEDAHQVDIDDAARLVGRDEGELDEVLRDAGIVDRDVEIAEALDRQLDEPFGQGLVGDVAGNDRAIGLDLAGRPVERGGIEVGEDEAGASGGEPLSRPAAEAARRTGDQHRQSIETPQPYFPSSTSSAPRRDRCFTASSYLRASSGFDALPSSARL